MPVTPALDRLKLSDLVARPLIMVCDLCVLNPRVSRAISDVLKVFVGVVFSEANFNFLSSKAGRGMSGVPASVTAKLVNVPIPVLPVLLVRLPKLPLLECVFTLLRELSGRIVFSILSCGV